MKILFFDDERDRFEIFKTRFPSDTIVYAQTIDECRRLLESHINGTNYFDVIHFDHDIYDEKLKAWYNTQGIAEWFVTKCPPDRKPKMAVIHSVNDAGGWALYHIFMKLVKTWRSPFRLESPNDYALAALIGDSLELKGS